MTRRLVVVGILVGSCLLMWLTVVALVALLVYITEHGGTAVLVIAILAVLAIAAPMCLRPIRPPDLRGNGERR